MIKNWEEAEKKLKEIFPDMQERCKIRGALLKTSSEDRLLYFVSDNKEIKLTLLTLLPSKHLLLTQFK